MFFVASSTSRAMRSRVVSLIGLAIALAYVLSGCSVWPKALSLASAPVGVEARETVASASIGCAGCSAKSTPPQAPAPAAAASEPVAKESVAAPAPVEAAIVVAPVSEKTVLAPMITVPPPPASKQPPAAVEMVAGFYINVGLFAVPENAERVMQSLDAAKMPAFVEIIQSTKGKLRRVRVGPFEDRAKADAAAKKIRVLKLGAIVFKH